MQTPFKSKDSRGAERVEPVLVDEIPEALDSTEVDHRTVETLANTVAKLENELNTLNNHRFVKIQNSLLRLLGQQILKGMALGLGSVLGASILVSLVIYLASGLEFIPIIGDWVQQILAEIKNSPNYGP